MKLVACKDCHAQFDVTTMAPGSAFDCRCGATLEATPPVGIDAPVRRCSGCGALARNEDEHCAYCRAAIVQVASRGSLICPECLARNLDDARFCLACGIAFAPQQPRQSAPEIRCPCCESWLIEREVGGLLVQECAKCNGLWAPDGVLEALVDRAATITRERLASGESATPRVDGGNPAAAPVEYRRCPRCETWMVRRNFHKRSGVIIDLCHEHGTWLDAHELEQIAGFILSGRAADAARTEQVLRETRERDAARMAARRVQLASFEARDASPSIFSSGRSRRADGIGSILELLASILN